MKKDKTGVQLDLGHTSTDDFITEKYLVSPLTRASIEALNVEYFTYWFSHSLIHSLTHLNNDQLRVKKVEQLVKFLSGEILCHI